LLLKFFYSSEKDEIEWIFISKGSQKEIKKHYDQIYSIRQNKPSQKKYERLLFCKNIQCPSKAKTIHFFETNELHYYVHKNDHLNDCKYKDLIPSLETVDMFEDPLFFALSNSNLPPTTILKNYNRKKKKQR